MDKEQELHNIPRLEDDKDGRQYRYLEKKLDNWYTVGQIIDTLLEMNFIKHEGKGYQPTYTRTELTDALHEAFGFCTSKEIVPVRKMKKICTDTKRQRE